MATYEELGIEIRGSRGTQKVKCPTCSHTRKDKRDKSLSVNLDKGVYNCHNCGWSGFVNGKTKDEMEIERKKYAKPNVVELPLSEKVIVWFEKRGIARETLQYMKVTESFDWMPARGDVPEGKRTCINFNYFRGNEKVNIKYRDAKKCFRMTKDAELVLYNMNALAGRTDMLICEGEIDAMTFYQSGHYGAVSVPNGASKGNSRLEYLDNCADVFDKMEKIILATDGDEAGIALRDELARRLGTHRCWFVTYPEGCKDANEVLLKYGPEAVRTLWVSAIAPPIEDILTVADMEPDLDEIYVNGWPKIEPIGYRFFDTLLNFAPSEVTTVTGIPQHGKDEFIRQILIRKAARYGEKSFIFNYEEPAKIQAIKACQQYIGRPFYRKDQSDKMNPAQKDAAYKFVNAHLFFIDITSADLTIDGLLKKAAEMVLRKNVKYVVFGPYNCIEGQREQWQTEGEYVSEIYQKMTRFATQYKVHIFFVAHTTKMYKNPTTGVFDVPNLYSIAGSANFFNKTHNGLSIYRHYDRDMTDVHVQKCKFFFNGHLGFQSFHFDVPTARYAEEGTAFESELDFRRKQEVQLEMNLTSGEPPPSSPAGEGVADCDVDNSVETKPDPTKPSVWSYPASDLSGWTGAIDPKDVPF